jgi:hypothetical protein
VKATNLQIQELKEKRYDDLTNPVCSFVTFEEEEGYNRACDFKPDVYSGQDKVLGEPLRFTPSCEPTNIIWENREIEGFRKFFRFLFAMIAIMLLILLSFTAILLCKQYSIEVGSKYPNIACEPVEKTYGTNF